MRTAEYIGSVARLPVLPARLALVAGVTVLCLRLLIDIWRYARAIVRQFKVVTTTEQQQLRTLCKKLGVGEA